MSNWVRLGKDCPICIGNRKHRDCRQSLESGLVFCHDETANPSGWIFRGFDKYGFGVWQDELDAKAYTEKSREEKQRERQERQQQQRQRKQAQIAAEMPPDERDRWNRRLIELLSLSEGDRAHLESRGYSSDQIEREGYRSIEQWQSIPASFPDNFPGRTQRGNLGAKLPGILCLIPDVEGRIVGFQVRKHDDSEGRYGWLSSKIAPVHLGGELPLGVYQPQPCREQAAIWMTDSPAIKSSLAAQLLGVPVVGATNGNFQGSPELTRQTLAALSDRYQTTQLILALDAGDVKNKAVCQRWQKQYEFLRGLGYSVWFAWWGQIDKTHCDIDELEPRQLRSIRLITLADFEAIAVEHGGIEAKKLTKKERKAQERERRRQLARQHYEQLSQLQSEHWKTINTPSLNFDELELESGAVYIVCSAKGTRKTEGVKAILPQFRNVYAWFSRIALGREECHRLDLTWREEMGSYQGFLKVGFCSNSAYKFNPRHLQDRGLLLVDEADQVFDHNFSTVCNGDGVRPLILQSLSAQIGAAIAGEGMALFMSADITDRDVDYIKALTPPGVPVRLIVNEYQPPRGTVIFSEARTPDSQIDQLIQKLEAGIPCFVIDDIKDGVRGCKSIAQLILRLHPEWSDQIVEINSETSCTEAIQQFLANINNASRSIRLLCCSPSVVSGISITNGRFNAGVFGFFNGILTITQASQALCRVRGAETLHCWATERGLCWAANRSTDPQDIKRWYRDNYAANAKHIGSFALNYNPLNQEFESPHFDLYCKNSAYRNACQTDFRELLRLHLEREGYMLQSVQSGAAEEEAIKAGLKESWQAIELEKARAIGTAELLSDSELSQKMNSSTRPTLDEQRQIEKTLLHKQFGQELIESLSYTHKSGEVFQGYEAAALKNRRGKYHRELEAFHLLQCPIAEAALRDWEREDKQLRQAGERFAGDVRWKAAQRELREKLGLKSLQPGIWYSMKDLQPIVDEARANTDKVKDLLSCSIENLSDGQVVGELFRQVGLTFDEEWITLSEGKRQKMRRINQQSWDQAWQFVHYRELLKVQPEPEVITASATDHPPVVSFSEARGGGDQNSSSEQSVLAASSHVPEPEPIVLPEVPQEPIAVVLPCVKSLSEQEVAEFAVCVEFAAESGGEAVQRLWRNWGDRLKRLTLNAVKRQIPVLYQRLEAMLWTSADGYLFL